MRPARPVHRITSLLIAAVLPLAALTACGSDDNSAESQLDKVSVSGAVGDPPTVEIDGQLDPEGYASEVAVEGTGPVIEDGDTVLMQAWVGNGYTGKEAISTYDYTEEGYAPDLIQVTTKEPTTEEVSALQQSALSVILDPDTNTLPDSIVDSLIGVPGGSRVVIVSDSADAYGDLGQPNLGIGNKDPVVWVLDILTTAYSGPEGTDVDPPAGTPSLVEDDGTITGFDFTDATAPTSELQVIPLVTGEGPAVEAGQTVIANYLGQVYQAETPFDESYSGGIPRDFVVGGENAAVIEGWNQGLVGQTVGSRVILVIPPALGYPEGKESAGIAATDTLYFVVDILGAATVKIPEPDPTTSTTDTAGASGTASGTESTPADPSASATE